MSQSYIWTFTNIAIRMEPVLRCLQGVEGMGTGEFGVNGDGADGVGDGRCESHEQLLRHMAEKIIYLEKRN